MLLLDNLRYEAPILLVEYDMDAAFSLANIISVLDYGKVIASDSVEGIKKIQLFNEHIWGGDLTLLSLKHVSASYGSTVLFDVNFSLDTGKALALWRNGMGKSTSVKSICKMISAKGDIRFDGKDLSNLSSHEVARLGVGLVPEGRRCFKKLTVNENLLAAARTGFWQLKTVAELFPRLSERSKQIASSLSGGEQQMLAIGRALMTNPKLLILDEATEGLAPIVRQEIWAAISKLKSRPDYHF